MCANTKLVALVAKIKQDDFPVSKELVQAHDENTSLVQNVASQLATTVAASIAEKRTSLQSECTDCAAFNKFFEDKASCDDEDDMLELGATTLLKQDISTWEKTWQHILEALATR